MALYSPPAFHNYHPDRPDYWNPDGEDPIFPAAKEFSALPYCSEFGGLPDIVRVPPPRESPPGYWGDVSGLGGTRLPPPTPPSVRFYAAPPPALPALTGGFVPAPKLSPFEDRRTPQERHVSQDYDWDYSRQSQAAGAAYDPSVQSAPLAMFPNVPEDQTVDQGLDYAIASGNYDSTDFDY
jgi:hypothetical protein